MKKLIFSVLFIVASLSVYPVDIQSLPEPYCHVNLMPFEASLGGNWRYIKKLVDEYHPKVFVEVGCWVGMTTIDVANNLPDDAIVYAVDTWKGSPNEKGMWDRNFIYTLYDRFLSNVIHAQLTHKIIPVRMSSLDAARGWQAQPDLLYLDATHTYRAVIRDLNAWFPLIKSPGALCGDDWGWGNGGVGRAVQDFTRENKLQYELIDNWFWIIRKP